MLKITPKNNLIEFKLQISNTSIKNTKARLIVEVQDAASTMIDVEIDGDGKCLCEIPLQENWDRKQGKVKLEVIADNMYFTPYEKEVFFISEVKKPKVTLAENKIVKKKETIKESVEVVSIPKIVETKEEIDLAKEIKEFFSEK